MKHYVNLKQHSQKVKNMLLEKQVINFQDIDKIQKEYSNTL